MDLFLSGGTWNWTFASIIYCCLFRSMGFSVRGWGWELLTSRCMSLTATLAGVPLETVVISISMLLALMRESVCCLPAAYSLFSPHAKLFPTHASTSLRPSVRRPVWRAVWAGGPPHVGRWRRHARGWPPCERARNTRRFVAYTVDRFSGRCR